MNTLYKWLTWFYCAFTMSHYRRPGYRFCGLEITLKGPKGYEKIKVNAL